MSLCEIFFGSIVEKCKFVVVAVIVKPRCAVKTALRHREHQGAPLPTNKICFLKITSKSVGATCGRLCKIMRFYVIYGVCLSSVVGVDVLDDPQKQ